MSSVCRHKNLKLEIYFYFSTFFLFDNFVEGKLPVSLFSTLLTVVAAL